MNDKEEAIQNQDRQKCRKNSKSEKKQVCLIDLKRLDSNTEKLECEEHNQLNQLDYELVLDRKLRFLKS